MDWVLGSNAGGNKGALGLPRPVSGPTEHTPGLRSIFLVAPGAVDADALVIWLEFLAKRRSHELMRAKGVVAAAGQCLVIQGVYRWLEVTEESGPVPDESRLVLIGRDLNEAEVRRGWAAVTGPA